MGTIACCILKLGTAAALERNPVKKLSARELTISDHNKRLEELTLANNRMGCAVLASRSSFAAGFPATGLRPISTRAYRAS